MALKSDGRTECRETSYQLVRGRLAMTGPESEGLAGCSLAVRSGPLKPTNSPFLNVEAPKAFQPAFIWALVRKSGDNRLGQEGWVERGPLNCITGVAKFSSTGGTQPRGLLWRILHPRPSTCLGNFPGFSWTRQGWEVCAGDSGIVWATHWFRSLTGPASLSQDKSAHLWEVGMTGPLASQYPWRKEGIEKQPRLPESNYVS